MSEAHWFPKANLDWSQFASEYWQKKPAVIGQLDISTLADIDLDYLLELAADDLVESRIIGRNGTDFTLDFGPFDDIDLDARDMLMVQCLESMDERISDWLDTYFKFLPRWRIDDVMASFGNVGATCGPHFDHYDVFLVQLRGSKLWRLDGGDHTDEDLDQNQEIRLLSEFHSTFETEQMPGSILYIPPGVGHHGIASDDSLTLSVGLRNPTTYEMISHLADKVGDSLSGVRTPGVPLTRVSDTDTGAEVGILQDMLSQQLLAPELLGEWFGEFMTELREPELLELPTKPFKSLVGLEGVKCHLATRTALTQAPTQSGKQWNLAINGISLKLEDASVPWARQLSDERQVSLNLVPQADIELVLRLLNSGSLVPQ